LAQFEWQKKNVNKKYFPVLLGIPCFLPFLWRLSHLKTLEPIGLLSDLGCGLLLWGIVLSSPYWLRLPLLLFWVLFQAASQEMFVAIQRLPSWDDLQFLADPSFVSNSMSGLHLAYPFYTLLLFSSFFITLFLRSYRPRPRFLVLGAVTGVCLLAVQIQLGQRQADIGVDSRYNPLHWFVRDVLFNSLQKGPTVLTWADLPSDLQRVDMNGNSLLEKYRAKNVLLVVLEGIPGLYHQEIRQAMGVNREAFTMQGLAGSTEDAMLIPDFVTHSHQTIRGLYSLLCGDYSKLSNATAKAFELQQNLDRAGDCLPSTMAEAGWSTHFLQAANLNFMSKDRVMPMIGFQEVHGSEWFTEPDPGASMWGPSDSGFFRGVIPYIRNLQAKEKPWLLTLLTVGTHHPFYVSDEVAARYPDRRTATVALLDEAVAEFIKELAAEKVFDDTLVIVTTDESHGSALADWMSSWGICIVMAPKQEQLPRLKSGTYGLVDVTPSILDYLGLEIPSTVVGRSFFRDYRKPREMVSYTGGKLRWHTAENFSFTCSKDGNCWKVKADSLLGDPPDVPGPDDPAHSTRLWSLAAALDHSLVRQDRRQLLQFAGGEIRKLPEKRGNEWTDNLAGAQYLQFPAGSRVHVSIRVTALEASDEGLQLQLFLRQHEILVSDISYEAFPVLHKGEVGEIEFSFVNSVARPAFSFHLVGEGKNATVQLEEFNVTVEQDRI